MKSKTNYFTLYSLLFTLSAANFSTQSGEIKNSLIAPDGGNVTTNSVCYGHNCPGEYDEGYTGDEFNYGMYNFQQSTYGINGVNMQMSYMNLYGEEEVAQCKLENVDEWENCSYSANMEAFWGTVATVAFSALAAAATAPAGGTGGGIVASVGSAAVAFEYANNITQCSANQQRADIICEREG